MFPVSRVCFALFLLLSITAVASAGQLSKEVTDKIDAAVALAYQAASAKLPCKISTNGRNPMLRWQDVDKCMDQAQRRVNWGELSDRIKSLRSPNVSGGDFADAVEASLSRQALPYEKVFLVKNAKALLPLTNSILKYLPPNSLMDQPVFDQKGKQQVGTFAGVFFYERAGGLASANGYRLALFQYADPQGKMQSPPNPLLLDSFGVPWAKVMTQPGFRFPISLLPEIGRGNGLTDDRETLFR
jgi:hypothetical protein